MSTDPVRLPIEVREYLNERLASERRHFDAQLAATAAALELQRTEYARRLEELNHAHTRAAEALATYIPRETYYSGHRELEVRVEQVAKTLGELQIWRGNIEGRMLMLAGAIGLFLTVLSIALKFIP